MTTYNSLQIKAKNPIGEGMFITVVITVLVMIVLGVTGVIPEISHAFGIGTSDLVTNTIPVHGVTEGIRNPLGR